LSPVYISKASLAQNEFGINDIIVYISAMTHHVALIAFDGFQLLDVSGPSAVYGAANDQLGRVAYEIAVIASEAPTVLSNCTISLSCVSPHAVCPTDFDSVFVTGGEDSGLIALTQNAEMRDWVKDAAAVSQRYGSICSGSATLAEWGLIGARRFASHWMAATEIRTRWPGLNLDADSIFVEDGPLWTSAGVSTGIDMTLAIVERDHGAALARTIAQRLVLSVRRPGWQSQFSQALTAQAGRDGRYGDLIAWIAAHVGEPMSVEDMAARAGETLRSFHRNFVSATGQSPAAYVTHQRLDHARDLIADGVLLKSVAARTGFTEVARLSAAFQRKFGMGANAYRTIHGRSAGNQSLNSRVHPQPPNHPPSRE
jgi:transcriptional regulator GlxA family with amidase domain